MFAVPAIYVCRSLQLPSFHKFLRPSLVNIRVKALFAAQFGNAFVSAQSFRHDTDFFLLSIFYGCEDEYRALSFLNFFYLSSSFPLRVTMN